MVGPPQAKEIFSLRDVVPLEVVERLFLTLEDEGVVEDRAIHSDDAGDLLSRRRDGDAECVIVVGVPLLGVAVVESSVLVEVLARILDLDSVHRCAGVSRRRVRRIGIVSLSFGRIGVVGIPRLVAGVAIASRHHEGGGDEKQKSQHGRHLSAMGLILSGHFPEGITPEYHTTDRIG